jgi:integrase
VRFTDTFIRNLRPKEKMYQLREGAGFGIRVLPSGFRIWIFTYTYDGKRRQMNLGNYPDKSLADARTVYSIAYSILHDKHNPRDPQDERDQKHEAARQQREELRKASTVADLAEEYIKKHAKPKKRSWEADERILDVKILPKWGKLKAREIKRRDVVLLLEEIAGSAPVMANRTRSLLHKMFNFALEREIVEANPCAGIKPPKKEKPRERVLSDDEIKRLWDALSTPGALHASPEIAKVLQLILVTGQRPGEVVGMHSAEIKGEWWTIPAERAKNGRAHRVFLTATAKRILGEKKGYIFESPKGGKPMEVNALAHVVRRNVEKPKEEPAKPVTDQVKEPAEGRQKLVMDAWTPHDLRRTAATNMSALGYSDEVIDAVLNHKKQGIVATYNLHKYDREKQKALGSLERKLNSIITGKQGNVIPMQRKAKEKK